MLHITVVQYEKGDRQTQNVQEKKQIMWKKSKNQYENLKDNAMCIMIFQDTWDMVEVMEARPPGSPVLRGFFTAKPGNRTVAPPWPHPDHIKKCLCGQEVSQIHS